MSTTRQLTFMGTPVSVALSIIVVLLTIALGFQAWRRSGYSRSQGLLELLRLLIVSVVALLLNQPEWIEKYRPDVQPAIAVLWDDSESMRTTDVPSESSATTSYISRPDSIVSLANESTWSSLDDRLNVIVQPIARGGDGQGQTASGTNLHTPLLGAASRIDQLLGVVLVSDGDWNLGSPPVEAAMQLRMRNIPIFTVAVGSPSRLPDVELTSVGIPTFGAVGKPIRIPITIDSSLPREFATTITLTASDGGRLTKDVRIAPMGRTFESISWKPEKIGDYTLAVSIPKQADETIPDNNARSALIAIRQEQLKVLIVESYPRWEYRYLRNALSRDPGVEVSCLLFHPGLQKMGGGSRDYIKDFPDTIEQLAQFDVVFLGDVGLGDSQLTLAQCDLVKGLVEHQASGVVLMPGWQGRQMSLSRTPLDELIPVIMDQAKPGGWGSRSASRFELTQRGRSSLLTRLAEGERENVQVWEDLPGFQWYAPVIRAKAGSDVLAVHHDMSNQYGRLPLLVTRTFGAGKVLFMGTDGAWRWRKGVEDKYHYRFWGQVVRWMAYQRNMAKGETMRLFYTPDQPQIRQTLTFNAHVMDEHGEPLQKGDVIARIETPSGRNETVRLLAEGDQWGVFEGRYTPEERGKHQVTLACAQTSATLETSLFVQGKTLEQVGKPSRPDVLQELARVTRGKSVQPNEIDEVIRSLAELPLPPPSIRRLQLWSHPLSGAFVVFLLVLFWIGRKVVGLI